MTQANDDKIKIKLLLQRSGSQFNREQVEEILNYIKLYCKDIMAEIHYEEH